MWMRRLSSAGKTIVLAWLLEVNSHFCVLLLARHFIKTSTVRTRTDSCAARRQTATRRDDERVEFDVNPTREGELAPQATYRAHRTSLTRFRRRTSWTVRANAALRRLSSAPTRIVEDDALSWERFESGLERSGGARYRSWSGKSGRQPPDRVFDVDHRIVSA